MRQAVILAGGKGTRLAERLNGLPKPLVDICGVPLLERQIALVRHHGFTRVLILVSHAAERIVDYCASRDNWGLDLQCIDDGEPRGTAGAMLAVMDRLDDEFLVIYGDTMLNVDLDRFHRAHRDHTGAAGTLFLHPNDHPHDSDLVEVDEDGWITAFHPYPHDPGRYYPNLVNAALYWLRREALEPFRGRPGLLDFGKHLFPEMIARGTRLAAYNSPEYIKDAGTPKRLDKICADLASGRIERSSLEYPQKAVFLDRDGTLNRELGHLRRAEDFELLPGAALAVRRLNHSDFRTVVVTNQPVLARGDCSPAELARIHAKMDTQLGAEGAFLDRVLLCPHHPDRGFPGEVPELKRECDCRKPRTGMVDRACAELNIRRDASWLVGDTLVDVATAHNAGLRSVLVETGYAGLDYRAAGWPDYVVPDLAAAVELILAGHDRLVAEADRALPVVRPGDRILIGGLSRSGKSNFSSALAETLRARGLTAHILRLDRWLRDEADRSPGVLGRYDLDPVREFLRQSDGARARIPLPGYHKLRRQRLPAASELACEAGDVVIVEGTVALELGPELPGCHRILVTLPEAERRERVLREYALRGMAAGEAERIYEARQADEAPLILAGATGAIRIGT